MADNAFRPTAERDETGAWWIVRLVDARDGSVSAPLEGFHIGPRKFFTRRGALRFGKERARSLQRRATVA